MWTRAELKQRAKDTFKLNYWKCVLVALLLALVAGSMGGSSGSIGSSISSSLNGGGDTIIDYSDNDIDFDYEPYYDEDDMGLSSLFGADGIFDSQMVIVFVAIFLIIFLIVLAIACVVGVFLFNPIEVGCNRFFIRNLHEKAQVGNVCFAFDTNYLNNVKILFFRDLYTVLWTLLFIIPGIVKSYEYRMIPYILAENPHMPKEEVFETSKRMMYGNKWRAFVLDLSFLGWHILSAFTLGILEVFYVAPYMYATNAALYEALAYGRPTVAPDADSFNAGFNNADNNVSD